MMFATHHIKSGVVHRAGEGTPYGTNMQASHGFGCWLSTLATRKLQLFRGVISTHAQV
jgi:hypothetical protein